MRRLWQTVVAVAWAFLGIRKRSEARKDISQLTPLHIIAVGLIIAVAFVAVLIGVVNVVVTKL